MLQVTPAAIDQFKAVLSQLDKEGVYIRIFVNGMGWNGPSLGLTLEESFREGQDEQKEIDGVAFVYEERIAPFVNDKKIDFITGPQSGFQIKGMGPDSCCDSCTSSC